MLVGQQLGPFTIDKELGSGAMGSVYLARYTKTGQRMALKLIALGLAGNEQALARFEREAEILKQLRHPNIVRLYGTGRFQGAPYYAMEYIEGESLDRLLARRGRFGWEEVVHFGTQICAALQHAHEKGIVHRDLKPSNLMVLPEGILKLTDFGIAKDMDATALTAANSTVGTASYMSPEQCRGERDLTVKSDLYSLGVVFYEMLSGRKPFIAETPMDMFLLHIQAQCERPSKFVMDLPPWLDTLVMHLMEKKPDQRPRDAATVARSLEQVAEKVAAQQSAGVDVVKPGAGVKVRARTDDETDKETARALRRAVSGKKAKKRRGPPFYQTLWFKATGLGLLLLLVLAVLIALMQPPSAEKLYNKAGDLMLSADREDWFAANADDGPLKKYLRHYGKRDDERTKEIRAWVLKADAAEAERRLGLLVRSHKGQGPALGPVKPRSDVEAAALDAVLAEESGDLKKATDLWEPVRQQKDQGWAELARQRLDDIKEAEDLARLIARRIEVAHQGNLPYAADTAQERLAMDAIKLEMDNDLEKARTAWQEVKTKSEKADERVLWLTAAKRVRDLTAAKKPPAEPTP
jgi:serine/threonine-protein kinase